MKKRRDKVRKGFVNDARLQTLREQNARYYLINGKLRCRTATADLTTKRGSVLKILPLFCFYTRCHAELVSASPLF